MARDVLDEIQMRVAMDITDVDRKLGTELPADLEKSAQRIAALQASLEGAAGVKIDPTDLLATRIDRASRALEVAKTKASELIATLAALRAEQATLNDFTTRAQQKPPTVTGEEVAKFSPILAAGRLEKLSGTDAKSGLIDRTEAVLNTRLAQLTRAQDRVSDLLTQQLQKTVATTSAATAAVDHDVASAASTSQRQQTRAIRGVGQGLLRGIGGGLALPLGFGVAAAGGILIGESIGRAFRSANEELTKTEAALASLRGATGLSVEGVAAIAASAEAAGVSVERLAAAESALRDKGITLDDAVRQLLSIEDAGQRAAEAVRLFGAEQAKGIAPLLTGARGGSPDIAKRQRDLAELQRIDQLGKALENRGAQSPLSGIVRFFQEAGTGAQVYIQRLQAASRAEGELLARNPVASIEEIARARRDAIAAVDAQLRGDLQLDDAIDRAAASAEKFAGAQFEGTRALVELSTASAAADRALANVGDTMDRVDRTALGLSATIDDAVRTAFDALSTAGVADPDIARALSIAVQAHLDPKSTELILQQLQGVGDLAGSTLTNAINSALGAQLSAIGEQRLQSVIAIQERRQSITERIGDIEDGIGERRSDVAERIADIEERIAERHQANAKSAFDFSKAELEEKLRAREDEKAFFAFRPTADKSDVAKQDAADQKAIARLRSDEAKQEQRDARTLAALQKELVDSDRTHPDLAGDIKKATELRDTFNDIAATIKAAGDITVNHKLTFSVEGGPVLMLSREDAVKDRALILGIFGESFADMIITAAQGGKRIVENTRTNAQTVPIGGVGAGRIQ